jgi:hypothetical protein
MMSRSNHRAEIKLRWNAKVLYRRGHDRYLSKIVACIVQKVKHGNTPIQR